VSVLDAPPNDGRQPAQFAIEDAVAGNQHRLFVSGELDLATAPRLEEAVVRICRDGTSGITIDLTGITFMDSSGLHAVLNAQQLCREHGRDFLLTPPEGQAKRLFEVTGALDQVPLEAG
jgi:anti-sigma B factor antagonist